MKNWRIWLGFALVLLLAAAGIYGAYRWWLADPLVAAQQAQFVPVERGRLVVVVHGAVAVAVPTPQTLNMGTGGHLRELNVVEGRPVEAGTILARLDTTDLEMQVRQAEAALALSRARLFRAQEGPTAEQLAAAEAALAAAQAHGERVKAGPLAAEIASAEAAVRSAEATYRQLEAGRTPEELTVLKANLEKARIVVEVAQREYDKWGWQKGFEASPQAAALQNATIDYQQAEAAYKVASAGATRDELARAQAQIAQARAQLAQYQSRGGSDEVLSAQAAIAHAQAEWQALKDSPNPQDVAVAQQQVKQAELGLEQAQRQLERAALLAPAAGTVSAVLATVGQAVSPATPILALVDLSQPQFIAVIHETYIAQVREGQPAVIHLDALPGQPLAGRVQEIAPLPMTSGALVSYAVTIGLDQPEAALRPGMAGRVEIVTSEKEAALLVPKSALCLRDGQWMVRALRDGRLQECVVQLGGQQERRIEVVGGLTEGEQVMINTISLSGKR